MNLQAGWNKVYLTTEVKEEERDQYNHTRTTTLTMSTIPVSGLKWYFEELNNKSSTLKSLIDNRFNGRGFRSKMFNNQTCK